MNVLSVMPVPAERSLVLQYCRKKLKKDGLILWYSQTTQSIYSDKGEFGDGLLSNESDRYKTFYKDYKDYEIDELFAGSGLRLKAKKVVPHVTARLYHSAGNDPLEAVLSAAKIRKFVEGDVDYSKAAVTVKRQILKGTKGSS